MRIKQGAADLFEYSIRNYFEHFLKNFDYMLNCVDVNYKVASFKCRYNGNQKRDLSGRRVMKQKALPSETLTNVLTRSKITANLIGFTKFRFGTCLSFMKCFDHFWTNDFSTKEGFKNFKLDLILHVRNLKARITFWKHGSLSRFPTKCVLWILWP